MQEAFRAVHADAAHRAGWTGAGVGVAVLDTGVFPHWDLEGRIQAFQDMLHGSVNPYDDNGHGTHVAGVIGGDGRMSGGQYRGIAPGCRLSVVKVLDARGNGELLHMFQGLSWILENYRRLRIRIVNISVGTRTGGEEEESPLVRQVNRLWDAGLVVVAAAGNNGPGEGTVTAPGISRKVITVGSSDDSQMPAKSGRPWGYSGRGPTSQCVMKPEVTAPGSSILACSVCPNHRPPFYTRKSGTSMSTPIVSGAIALLLEKYPWMTNVDVKLALRESCRRTGAPATKEGWGLLDIRRLLA